MDDPIEGKVVLVTGATNGIGLVTARELSRMGALVTIISRESGKCEKVAKAIAADSGHPVEFIAADLSLLAGIKQAAETFIQTHSQLHVLVNNAGGFFTKRKLTPDGFEMTFALNHLNYFLLTILLIELLKSSAPARIVNVASGMHVRARMDFNNLQGEKKYTSFNAYGQSKLANLLFTYELARRLEGSGVTVNALHPGYVHTGLAQNNGAIIQVFAGLLSRTFGRKPEEGARTSIFLATSPEVEGVSGKYYADCRQVQSSPESYSRSIAEKLWTISLELTGESM
jgi:NAD(P)-dependent dehydrogenase (short-subunit alcohol dehydrogenase family)